MLSGPEIKRHVLAGTITIRPFVEENLNPNSHDLTLDPWLKVYSKAKPLHDWWDAYYQQRKQWVHPDDLGPMPVIEPLDMRVEETTCDLHIPEEGLVIYPGMVYLAATQEYAGSNIFIPCVEGRSSVGRLAVFAHTSAGFGDLGFSGPACPHRGLADRPAQWTLELAALQPVRIYAGVKICQVIFTKPEHGQDLGPLPVYDGKYTGQMGPKPSGIWRDFPKKGQQ